MDLPQYSQISVRVNRATKEIGLHKPASPVCGLFDSGLVSGSHAYLDTS